jgi:hypothetical protein
MLELGKNERDALSDGWLGVLIQSERAERADEPTTLRPSFALVHTADKRRQLHNTHHVVSPTKVCILFLFSQSRQSLTMVQIQPACPD